jgi:hypothetical protein
MLFSKLNAVIVSPRMAPPVPKNPAKNPDRLPPIKVSFRPVLNENLGLIRKKILKPTKNTDSAICRY